MNPIHTVTTTIAQNASDTPPVAHRNLLSLARPWSVAFLFLPLAAATGCVAADGGTADGGDDSAADSALDDSAVNESDTLLPPRRVMPLRGLANPSGEGAQHAAPAATASVNSGHGINYHNGPVMSGQVNAYYIYYGSWSSADKTILNNFADDFGGSPNYNINTLYDDSTGGQVTNYVTLSDIATDNYSQGTTLTDAKVFTVVKTAIGNGSLPLDANGVYFVLTSPDVSESSGFCTQYCGWHTYGTYSNTTLKYSFVGNASTQCPSSCEWQTSKSPNGRPGADGMVSVIAHELEEATSDPKLNAWYDSSGYENADKCAWTFGSTFSSSNGATANMILNGHEYLVQQNWLNSGSGSCAVTYGQLGAHGGSGGSRFDTACDSGDVAVGFVGRSGSRIDNVGLICAAVNSDGSLSSSTYTTTQYGGSGGSAYTKTCPSGKAIVGVSGRSGSRTDQLTIKCSTLSNWDSNGTVQSTLFVGGGSGGSAFDDSCIKGHALNRITGRGGSEVDQVQGGCARVWPY